MTTDFFIPWMRCGLGLILAGVVGLTHAASLRPPSTSIAQKCMQLYPPDWRAVTGQVMAAVPADPRPPKGVPLVDPAHKTCVVRVTDHEMDTQTGFTRNDYSRRQAFNADNTLMIFTAMDGTWHVFSTANFHHLYKLKDLAGDAEPQWSPTDPDRLMFLPITGIGMQIYELSVATGQTRVAADLSKRVKAIWPRAQSLWTRSEGSPSRDHRYWAFLVDDDKWQGLGLVSYDLKEDKIVATYDLVAHKKGRPDHLSMSPSGQYIVVPWAEGVTVYNRDFSDPRVIAKQGEHSDIALNKDGEDVFVSVDYQGSGGPIYMVNLRTGKRTNLLKTYLQGTATAMHFSGKAYNRPGWAVVSTYADYGKNGQQWLHRKVFAMQLEESPRIVNLAHHHSQFAEYMTEPHASPNRDLTQVLFNSNWGQPQSKTDVDAFMVVVPEKAFAP